VAALREQTQSSDRYIASLKAAVEDASGYTKSLEGSLRDSRLHAGAMAERARAIEIDLKRADQEITNLRGEISGLLGVGAQLGGQPMISRLNGLSDEISALRASTSWKITRPLRAVMRPRRTLQFVLRRIGL
jgi:chromosome segregation ATPase